MSAPSIELNYGAFRLRFRKYVFDDDAVLAIHVRVSDKLKRDRYVLYDTVYYAHQTWLLDIEAAKYMQCLNSPVGIKSLSKLKRVLSNSYK